MDVSVVVVLLELLVRLESALVGEAEVVELVVEESVSSVLELTIVDEEPGLERRLEVVGIVDVGVCVFGIVDVCGDSVVEVWIGSGVKDCGDGVGEGCCTCAVTACIGAGVEVVGCMIDAILAAMKVPSFLSQHVVLVYPQQKLPSPQCARPW